MLNHAVPPPRRLPSSCNHVSVRPAFTKSCGVQLASCKTGNAARLSPNQRIHLALLIPLVSTVRPVQIMNLSLRYAKADLDSQNHGVGSRSPCERKTRKKWPQGGCTRCGEVVATWPRSSRPGTAYEKGPLAPSIKPNPISGRLTL